MEGRWWGMEKAGVIITGLLFLLMLKVCLQADAGVLATLQEWGRTQMDISAQSGEGQENQEDLLPGIFGVFQNRVTI